MRKLTLAQVRDSKFVVGFVNQENHARKLAEHPGRFHKTEAVEVKVEAGRLFAVIHV